ncbi:PKD domain-containing protein [Pontibacter silvestris]|nr:PKD domain-containing protein [Pontibacter silvestris]
MHDDYTIEDQVGVEVKNIAYAWNEDITKDFIILEYHIKNITPDTLRNLYSGVFADWDIGENREYLLNSADWDETHKLGYVYHIDKPHPYAGLALLTDDAPIYYAIDNFIKNDNYQFDIDDGFSTEEKFSVLSGGIARRQAGGSSGNDVSHVVGGAFSNLAPGKTKVIAFALLASDNLASLKNNTEAAQQKYRSFRTSATPLAIADTACVGSNVTWAPEQGSTFNFYADQNKETLIGSGASYTINNLETETTIYAASIDSVFESEIAQAVYSFPAKPVVDFKTSTEEIYPDSLVQFINQSKFSKNWRWTFDEVNFVAEENPSFSFVKPGSYQVTLTVSDKLGCTDTSITKTIEVLEKAATDTLITAETIVNTGKVVVLYPNPALDYVNIELLEDGPAGKTPEITFLDATGKAIYPKIKFKDALTVTVDLEGMTPGIYYARITYSSTTLIKRILISQN